MLDAARTVVLEHGTGTATVSRISRESGAPTGSLYHHFGSRDELVARTWMRAVRRAQAAWLHALDHPDPLEGAVAAGLAVLDFSRNFPADARLLVSFRQRDLVRDQAGKAVRKELEQLNDPVEAALTDLAEELFGSTDREAIERATMATFDLPYGAARRYLIAGDDVPDHVRGFAETAMRAVLTRQR